MFSTSFIVCAAFRCAYCYELNPARKTKPNMISRVSTSTLPPAGEPGVTREETVTPIRGRGGDAPTNNQETNDNEN